MDDLNPIQLVRQSSLPTEEKVVLTPLEIKARLQELDEPFRTIVLVAAVTGLRRGELFGPKWEDVGFHQGELRIVRSLVDQVEGPPKTFASRRPLPVAAALIAALQTGGNQSQRRNSCVTLRRTSRWERMRRLSLRTRERHRRWCPLCFTKRRRSKQQHERNNQTAGPV